jgi:hypothetical protein
MEAIIFEIVEATKTEAELGLGAASWWLDEMADASDAREDEEVREMLDVA